MFIYSRIMRKKRKHKTGCSLTFGEQCIFIILRIMKHQNVLDLYRHPVVYDFMSSNNSMISPLHSNYNKKHEILFSSAMMPYKYA